MEIIKLNTKAGFNHIYQVMQYNGYDDVIDAIIDIVETRNKYANDLITEAEVINAEVEEIMLAMSIILLRGG
jgi:hypothetical protein